MTFRPGMTIGGRYELGAELGSGGMARVYLAHDAVLDRQVAVKVLAESYATDPNFVERFRREASAAAGLNHPNIVAVYDRGDADGSYYIVMEYLSGPDLKQVIRRRAPLPPDQAVDMALQILAAVGAAHKRDIIHRDIKPQNVLVAEDGRLKVTDFGIAHAGEGSDMTEAGSVIGTAQYLSPEQARGDEVTAASDCYAVGIVLYEMLTGRLPFEGGAPVAVAMKQISDPPAPPRVHEPSIPPELDRIVLRALEKRPSERYRTAEDFAEALMAVRPALGPTTAQTAVIAAGAAGASTRVMDQPSEPTGPTRVAPPPHELPPRRRWPWVVGGLGVVALVAVVLALVLSGGGASTTTVPDVEGLQLVDAARAIRDADLSPEIDNVQRDGVEPGTAIGTDPPAGTELDKGDTVILRVSVGPETAPVPRVTGETIEDARRILTQAGFEVRVQREASEDVEAGSVISQTPRAGDEAAPGSDVVLVVSTGAEQVAVPSVAGRTQDVADGLLRGQGFGVSVVEQATDESSPGTVIAQSPAAGARVDSGTTVTITVAVAVPTETVPNVVGQTAANAQTALSNAGFNPISTTAASDEPEGTVISQLPSGDSQAEQGSTVEIVVSTGPGTTGTSGGGGAPPPPETTSTTGEPLP